MFVCHLVVNLPCALAFSLGFPNLLRPQLTPSLPLKLSSLFYYAIGFLVKTEREHLCTVYPELPKYVHHRVPSLHYSSPVQVQGIFQWIAL